MHAVVEEEVLEELEAEVQQQPDYMQSVARSFPEASESRFGRRRFGRREKSCGAASDYGLELREAEEARALSAAKQQRQSLSSRRHRRERSVAPFHESIKSAIIDSKVSPFVATVPRELPPPLGRVVVRDFRAVRHAPKDCVRVVTWNVERGYRLASVIASLRYEDADAVLLSEVDVGCDRSQMVDVGAEIAAALGLVIVFATEKIHVNDCARDDPSATDADAFGGVEGVAVLSRFDVLDFEAIFLPDASKKNDPRKQRLALRVACAAFDFNRPPLDLVAVHLDAFAGRSSRVDQFQPVIDDWRRRKGMRDDQPAPYVIGGDLNTHNHGVVALHPGMTGDDYWVTRLWRGKGFQTTTWGQTEAEWWQQNVFKDTTLSDPFDKNADGKHNPSVHVGGLKLWAGKLDWLLFDKDALACVAKHASRANQASDHPYLRLDLRLKHRR